MKRSGTMSISVSGITPEEMTAKLQGIGIQTMDEPEVNKNGFCECKIYDVLLSRTPLIYNLWN